MEPAASQTLWQRARSIWLPRLELLLMPPRHPSPLPLPERDDKTHFFFGKRVRKEKNKRKIEIAL